MDALVDGNNLVVQIETGQQIVGHPGDGKNSRFPVTVKFPGCEKVWLTVTMVRSDVL